MAAMGFVFNEGEKEAGQRHVRGMLDEQSPEKSRRLQLKRFYRKHDLPQLLPGPHNSAA